MTLQEEYNETLKRYYAGCEYLKEHSNEWDKYSPLVINLLDKMNRILAEIPATNEQILGGF